MNQKQGTLMRRVKSAPANLCLLSHRKVTEVPKQTQSASPVSRILRKGDALDGIVTSSLDDIQIEDPTEQLMWLFLVRRILSLREQQLCVKEILCELLLRMMISFTTQKFMSFVILSVHSHHLVTSVQTILAVPHP